MTHLYIAGPMTGIPHYNHPAFHAAEALLTANGHTTLNPARHTPDPNKTWADYMRRGIRDLLTCDGVALLPGWETSRGATLEHHIATTLHMPTRPLNEWATA